MFHDPQREKGSSIARPVTRHNKQNQFSYLKFSIDREIVLNIKL
jgi:hypothetical protein